MPATTIPKSTPVLNMAFSDDDTAHPPLLASETNPSSHDVAIAFEAFVHVARTALVIKEAQANQSVVGPSKFVVELSCRALYVFHAVAYSNVLEM